MVKKIDKAISDERHDDGWMDAWRTICGGSCPTNKCLAVIGDNLLLGFGLALLPSPLVALRRSLISMSKNCEEMKAAEARRQPCN